MTEWVWSGLEWEQARGRACVVCGISLAAATARGHRWRRSVWVAVGQSPRGARVFACVGPCEARAAALTVTVAVSDEALVAAGVAFVAALDAEGGDVRTAWPDDMVAAVLRAGAPLVVAAELRRLAGYLEADVGLLRSRAAQLDPGSAR